MRKKETTGHAWVRETRPLAVVASVCLTLALPGKLSAEILINPNGWKFPNIVTAAKEMIRVSDRSRDIAGKETILKGYRKWDGTFFRTYEIEGRIFGVEIDTDGKPPFEYSLMDADGDGKFETKIPHVKGNEDQAYVPQWVVDHYFNLHPDLKNTSGFGKSLPPSLRTTSTAPPVRPAPSEDPPPETVRRRPAP
ncbi:MAG: hypothetical protein O7A63_12230 [Acidobacteria bacterium]|nr:hypothetical protein [Acidobacteriota bacterium]